MSDNRDKFAERFTFQDLDGRLVERPLREMIPVEVLRAWGWHHDEADRVCREDVAPSEGIAVVEKAQRLWELIGAAMPDWPDGMSIGAAVHRFWPFGRAAS